MLIENEKICVANVELSDQLINKLLYKHKNIVDNRFTILNDYYKGKHAILNRVIQDKAKPNNKGVTNFCAYATDTLTSIFMGKPITYTIKDSAYKEELIKIFKNNDENSENHTLAHKSSVKGQAFELVYLDENGDICFDSLDTDGIIPIYDTNIRSELSMAIRYYKEKDILTEIETMIVEIYTKDMIYSYIKRDNALKLISEKPHFFGEVPVIEYANNRFRRSDFEGIMYLNDLYNLNQADISNDISWFSNCYLVLENMDGTTSEDINKLKEDRVLLTGENGKAYYLTKQLNDSVIQNNRDNLKEDIHKMSYIPDLSQELPANLSGSAIKQKWFSTLNVISNKERMFKKALLKRLRLITTILNLKGNNFNVNDVDILFNQNIPLNMTEFADSTSKLAGILPDQILFELLNKNGLEIDVDRAIELKQEQNEGINLDTIPVEGDLVG